MYLGYTSRKIWWVLNLAISDKTPYFLIRRILNLAIQSPRPKYYITTQSRALLPYGSLPSKILREVSSSLGRDFFGTIPSHLWPLLQCVLSVISLS